MDRLLEEVSDKLGDIYAKYYDRLVGSELEALSKARMVLEQIIEDLQAEEQYENGMAAD